MARLKKIVTITLLNVAILAGALVLLEGLASTALFVRELSKVQALAERLHTRYDSLLGWVNTPGVEIANMYGPGASLRINGQGFRNDRDFPQAVPAGKRRAICAGDSFTFGYGVDNSQTWCQLLAAADPQLETVNMGQGGYGIDQAYLWYKRDGVKLNHDIVLFAFITLDFQRMQQKQFLGYGKPYFSMERGALTLQNVPVPQPNALLPWLNQRRNAVRELRSFQLLTRLLARGAGTQSRPAPDESGPEDVADGIFAELARVSREHHSVPVLVYLPFRTPEEDDLRWQSHVEKVARERGMAFIDLVHVFDRLPPSEVASMYIPEGAIAYRGAEGHFTAKGNEYVARALLERLQPMLAQDLPQEPRQ